MTGWDEGMTKVMTGTINDKCKCVVWHSVDSCLRRNDIVMLTSDNKRNTVDSCFRRNDKLGGRNDIMSCKKDCEKK